MYECPNCPGKRFAQKWGMDLHIKKQHQNDAYQVEACKICGVRIQSKGKMKLHLASAHQVADEEQPYVEESD
jgi:DNA-directed RNA polymerase subunit RPC12/RpoP